MKLDPYKYVYAIDGTDTKPLRDDPPTPWGSLGIFLVQNCVKQNTADQTPKIPIPSSPPNARRDFSIHENEP
jgi:hypothetical protein